MIKNRTAQIVYYAIYITLAVLGVMGSLGYFDRSFNTDFYVFYTNLSNYLCMGFIIYELASRVKNKTDEKISKAPCFKFMLVIMILVTCLVYNFMLAPSKSAADYFLSPSNLIMHVILPIMFIVDWFLFYDRKQTKWYYPLLSTVMPLIYVVWIVIRGQIFKGATWTTLYPYFFLNVDKIGGMVAVWVIGLVVAFIGIGYLFMLLDYKIKWNKNKEKNNGN